MQMSQFGTLSAEQLAEVVAWVPKLDAMFRELRAELKTKSTARRSLEEEFVWWAPLYELSHIEHVAALAKLMEARPDFCAHCPATKKLASDT